MAKRVPLEILDLPDQRYTCHGCGDCCRDFSVQQICQFASNKRFTHLFVLSEKSKKCNGLIVSKLPRRPTAFFKVSNVECGA